MKRNKKAQVEIEEVNQGQHSAQGLVPATLPSRSGAVAALLMLLAEMSEN